MLAKQDSHDSTFLFGRCNPVREFREFARLIPSPFVSYRAVQFSGRGKLTLCLGPGLLIMHEREDPYQTKSS